MFRSTSRIDPGAYQYRRTGPHALLAAPLARPWRRDHGAGMADGRLAGEHTWAPAAATLVVTREIRSGETSTSYISRRCADVAGGHAARVQGDDPVAVPLQPGLALTHDLRLGRPVAVPGHRQVHRAHIGEHGLAGSAVAAVAAAPPGRVVLLITRRPGSPSRLRGTFAVSVIACPSASRNTCGPPSGHVTYSR